MDVEDQILPILPLQKGGIPLFGKEGLGEIFATMCLLNYGFLSNSLHPEPRAELGSVLHQDHGLITSRFMRC